MSTTRAQYVTALATAQATYTAAVNNLVGAMIDLEALAATVQAIGGGPQATFGQNAKDQWQNLTVHLEHPVAAPRQNLAAALRASAGTLTSSAVLNFASVPSWVTSGMIVYDITTAKNIGVVSTVGSTTVTMAANAANAVSTGDMLSFSMAGRIQDQINAATAVYMAAWSGT